MKLEFVGSLFAMLLSLFVTVDDTLLHNPLNPPYFKGEEQQTPPLKVSHGGRGEEGLKVWGTFNRGVKNDPPPINAQSAFVGCLCDEPPLYAMRASTQLPLASITKIMTSYLALRELGPDYLVNVSDEAIATEGIAGDLQRGEQLTVKDLIMMAMTYSSNDAAMALAEALGRAQGLPAEALAKAGANDFSGAIAQAVFLMNEEAFALGMRRTFFQNPTGLDLPRAESRGLPGGPSNFSTAEDWIILLKATMAHPLLWDLTRDPAPRVVSREGIVHVLINLNPFRDFPHYIGGKTGTTDFAGENLVMLFEKPLGKLHALILFGAPVGTREQEAQKLLDWIASF